MPAADTARLIADLQLKDNLSKGVGSAIKSVDRLETRLSKVGARAGEGLRTAAGRLEAGVIGLGAAAVGGLGLSVKAASDFEAQLNTINTVARETPARLKEIGSGIRALARDTGTSTEDLTAAFYDLVSAGIDAADAQKVLAASNTLAIGGLATTAETVDLLTTAINTYGGDASQAAKDADIFAKAIERGKVTAADLAASFATVGPVAAASGISLEELGAAYARLTSLGIPAAEAATDTRSAILALTRTTGPLEKLQKQTGKNYLALAGSHGLVFALEDLRKDADKAGVPLIELLGRAEALQFTLATTGPNVDAYREDLIAMGDAAGTASQQMGERQKGLAFQISKLKALAKDAGITIGTALLPKITDLAKRASDFINLPTTQASIVKLADGLAGTLSQVSDIITRIPWNAVADAMRLAGTGARVVLDAFTKLPPWVQTAVLTGWGLNKLTGGALTGIVGELGKGLIKGVLGINAGVVNINAATVNGIPGGIPGTAPAAAAGGLTAGAVATTAAVGVILVGGTAVSLNAILDEGAKNNQLAAKGLTQQEIIAQKYYNANRADQDRIAKQLHGAIPPRSVFESGNAKLLGAADAQKQATTQAAVRIVDRQEAIRADQARQVAALASKIADGTSEVRGAGIKTQQQIAAAAARQYASEQATRSSNASASASIRAAVEKAAAASRAAGQQAAFAIRDKDLSVRVQNFNTVSTSVSVRETIKGQTTFKSYYKYQS